MLIGFVIALISWLETAWVMSALWSWFIAQPLGVPTISFLDAIGLLSLIAVINHNVNEKTYAEIKKIIENKTFDDRRFDLLMPLYCLCIGAVAHCLM